MDQSIGLNPKDLDALCAMGGSWKNVNDDKAYKYYKKAFKVKNDDPYALGNVIIYELMQKKDLAVIDKRNENIKLSSVVSLYIAREYSNVDEVYLVPLTEISLEGWVEYGEDWQVQIREGSIRIYDYYEILHNEVLVVFIVN